MLSKSLSRRWKRLRVLSDKSRYYYRLPLDRLPLEWWIGRGLPLNPYLKGIIVDKALMRYKPRQLVLPPQESLWLEGEEEMLERTLYHEWMKEWLEYLLWYSKMIASVDPSLSDLFDPPAVNHTWKRMEPGADKVQKYDFLWRCWDEGDRWNLGTVPPCLPEGRTEGVVKLSSNELDPVFTFSS